MLRNHSLTHKQESSIVPLQRIRPLRVAARRQRELMVIIANEINGESVDWIEEEDLDVKGIPIPYRKKSIPSLCIQWRNILILHGRMNKLKIKYHNF